MCALKNGVQARISCFKYLPRLCKIGGTSLVLSGYISLFPIFYLEILKKTLLASSPYGSQRLCTFLIGDFCYSQVDLRSCCITRMIFRSLLCVVMSYY